VASVSVGRLLLVSSLAAREPALSDYAASKRAGETAARELAGDRLAVVRPPVIYGPGDRETLSLFRVAGRSPVMPVPANGAARLALAHADDVAAVILDVLERPELTGVYAVGGDRPAGYAWREIFTAAAQAMGASPAMFAAPDWAIGAAAALSERFGAMGGGAPIFTRGKARELLHADWSVTPAELPAGPSGESVELGEGFSRTVAWYRRAGWMR
jgi:nucleoside-diphosphate-sugar epimerase